MDDTHAHAGSAHAGAAANAASAGIGGAAASAVGRAEAQAGSVLATFLLAAAAQAVSRRIYVQGIPSAEAFGVPSVSVGGRLEVLASATVVPAGPDVEALVEATRALTDKVDVLITEFRAVVAMQQRNNPRWFATQNAMAIYTMLALLVALVALAGDRWDALDDDQHPAPPLPAVAPAVPQQGAPAPGR